MVHFWGVCPSFREVQVLAIVEILMGQLEQVDFLEIQRFSAFWCMWSYNLFIETGDSRFSQLVLNTC